MQKLLQTHSRVNTAPSSICRRKDKSLPQYVCFKLTIQIDLFATIVQVQAKHGALETGANGFMKENRSLAAIRAIIRTIFASLG
jgi:hypothetical protein